MPDPSNPKYSFCLPCFSKSLWV